MSDRIHDRHRLMTRRSVLRAVGLAASGLAGAACRGTSGTAGSSADQPPQDFSARFAAYEAADEPNADPAMVAWPPFVTRAAPEVKRLYEFQLQNGELMKYMPCFCGCHEEDGHRSNRDCYVEAVTPDGTVVLDAMAPT